ncbi:LOW QUALITY PROTEIN: pericentrin [Choloepus didactylus]|uniref:LOW QUALITY PROTEIN: pericentrin n=1 Tax=Choloepus didactylus TaxID=27675 RepID=UPI00189EF39E|nr:LOW QUALITY PROTEIN: pericentrin [Choloepus didactylus]
MEEDEEEQRRRKVEAGRAKLAYFRQRKTKGDCPHSKKKTAKRKGAVVAAPVQEESPVAAKDGGLPGGGGVWESASCSDTPGKAEGAFVAQEHEEEHEIEIAELSSRHKDEVDWLQAELGGRQQRATAPQAEMRLMAPQTQTAHSLELEALRLSLNNMHTAQLELTQANLQKEKETALMELREMLNSRRAQELALLQSRQQCELELLEEQHAREKEEIVLKCGQETAELKEKLESEMEKNAQILENLKRDWELERDLCLENLRKELSDKHQSEMENLQNQLKNELAEQKAELEKIFQAKNQAEFTLVNLEAQHEAAIQKLREELQSEHCQYLEDMEVKFKEKEKEKQLELESLQASYEELKAQSQEEIRHLWSQLDTARTNRQDLNEFHEQLLARAPPTEELEHLRRTLNSSGSEEREHETQLEQLRIYFEKKLRDAERNYQEDLTLLQQQLREMKEDSFLTSVEISSSTILEETSEKERKDYLDQLKFQLEQHKESLMHLQKQVEEKHEHELEALTSCLSPLCEEAATIRMGASGTHCTEAELLWMAQHLELERLHASLAEGHVQALAQTRLQHAQDAASEVETEVAARVLSLENEHKVKLSLLWTELKEEIEPLKIENRNLHEKLQHEIHLKEGLEKVNRNLVEDHQEELKKSREKIQLMKQEFKEKEDEWKVTSEDLKRKAEEKLALILLELREKAESEKLSIINKFDLRKTEMRKLQDQQAAQIQDLEKSLMEQQGRLRQLELGLPGDEPLRCSHCGPEPGGEAQGWGLATLSVQEDCALQLMLAQSRFLEERKEITEKFSAEQDALVRELQEKHASELQQLQEDHRRHMVALTAELQMKHQAEVDELKAALTGEHRALLETHTAELQTRHAAEISALGTRHLSNLDSLESCYQSEIQNIQHEHRQALESLQVDLEEQLQKKDSFHQMIMAQELEKLKLKHDEELQSTKDSLKIEMSTKHIESLKAMAAELQNAHQSELEREKNAALDEKEELHKLESEKAQSLFQKEKESLCLQLQEKSNQIQQLKDHILSLSNEIRECHSELEKLQQRRERENQEGTNLISMLKSDVVLSHRERKALQDALHRLLSLFGETLKAALAMKSQISERVGLCLDGDVGATDTESQSSVRPGVESPSTAQPLDETLPRFDVAPLDFHQLWPECAEMASVTEVSSHVRESFFMSPETTLECEQPIRKIYQSLGIAVDSLLEMALDSTKQLEEARQIHCHFEKEFNCKNEETAQVIKKQKELLECLNEESAAKTKLMLELHKAEGVIEGFKVERAALQEALGQKEESEERLVLELENLKQQLQVVTLEQSKLKEEYSVLRNQKNMLAAEAGEKEAGTPVTVPQKDSGLRKEVECLTKEHLETRKQAEKDRTALLTQLKVLELELEDQLRLHQACAQHAEEVLALEQQLASLDKHLRHQRQFMDEQAAEREHERDEFQQEIRRLEEQLRQAARPQPCGPRDGASAPLSEEVELLQEKLRQKSDGFNELVIKKELADRQLIIQEEEIKRLEETNADARRKMIQLQEELEKQKKVEKELQDKEALKAQQISNLTLASTLGSELDEAKGPAPLLDGPLEGADMQGEVVQGMLLQQEGEVLDLKEQLENLKDNLVSKNEEILHLNLKLDMQSSCTAISIRELQEENASLKAFLENKETEIMYMQKQLEAQPGGLGSPAPCEVMYNRSSEIEELKSIIENLQENQVRLQKDRAEEIEQLHEVIEKLQRELSLVGPVVHEVSDSQGELLQSELEKGWLCFREAVPEDHGLLGLRVQALEQELSAALGAQESLRQSLQATEEAAERQLAMLRGSVALKEAQVERMDSRIRVFEETLKEKETAIAEKELEIDALCRQRAAHVNELEAILPALSHWQRVLEQQPVAAVHEPVELQALRAQCARLTHQLQALNQRFLQCQKHLDKHQAGPSAAWRPAELSRAHKAEEGVSGGVEGACGDSSDQDPGSRLPTMAAQDLQRLVMDDLQAAKGLLTSKDAGLQAREHVISILTACQKQLESELLLVKTEMPLSAEDSSGVSGSAGVTQGRETLLEDCLLQKVDLITQVKQLQEKLNHLVSSMTIQGMETEDFEFQQPPACLLADSWSSSSPDDGQTDRSPPADGFIISQNTWDLCEVCENQDPLIGNEMSNFPIQEKAELQKGSLCLNTSLPSNSHDLNSELVEPFKIQMRAMDLSSWSSPEVVRKDSTLEPPPSLPLTPCADVAGPRGLDSSLAQADESGLLCYPAMSTEEKARWRTGPHSVDLPPIEKTPVEKDVEDFIITSFDSQENLRSPPLALEGKSDGSEKSDGTGIGELLNWGSGRFEPASALPVAAPAVEGPPHPLAVMKEKEVYPKHVRALLKMVCDESHQILALSEFRGAPSALSYGKPSTLLEHVPGDQQGLLGHLAPATQKGEKEPADLCLDWRGEFLQAVHKVFQKEGTVLKGELQSALHGLEPGGHRSLPEQLEEAIQEQGELQEKSLEHLRLSDRSSLLSEIQALRAQLRMTHLQNQEKLQQLCTALTSAEAHGSRQEHQLRRQVELLAYKVEQEKCIASDLQKTLNEEQEKATAVRKLLVVEQNVVKDLRSELSECKQENERLFKSLDDVQKEALQLRSLLDNQEKDLRAALQELESERGKERALQSRLEEEQLQHQQREGQSTKTLEELRLSLEKQYAHRNQLCVALKHEQTVKENLQKELQIEYSRCEALLAQERGKLSELQKSLEAEKSHSLELAEALQHERLLTEQLSRKVPELCAHQGTQRHHSALRRLKEEKARVVELQAMLEKVQQQALRSKQQLEAEVQMRCEEIRKEKEVSAKLKLRVEALQTQKQELRDCLEKERERPARAQAELEQIWSRLREQEGPKEPRNVALRRSRADAEKRTRWQQDRERLRELELQRQRDEHKIKQLQQTVRELEAREAARGTEGVRTDALHSAAHTELCFPPEPEHLREQQEELEKIRQQLLCAAGFLTNFINQTMDRTISDWTSSNEKAVTSLLQTLEELKSELTTSASSQKKMAAELQIQLVDVLLKDNESLTKALSTVTQEKVEVCRAVSKLERTLKHHLQRGCALSKSGRSAWKQERMALQSSARHTDPGLLAPAASEEASAHTVKMEKLYLHYLRAESFRKALIYQKKYLLLLIGGFQDSEQETLSMIAHLGVFPSKADKKVTASRPFTRFRTAVRVVIAILRLRFLVKKWQEVDRKGTATRGTMLCPGAPGPRQQRSPLKTRESPPTRDAAACSPRPTASASPCRRERSNPSPNSRSERSLTASQDPEHSLTEYIHHLEMIQHRLGGYHQIPLQKNPATRRLNNE